MKITIICLCLFILTACAHKPVASPEEVNQYLNDLACVAADYGYMAAKGSE